MSDVEVWEEKEKSHTRSPCQGLAMNHAYKEIRLFVPKPEGMGPEI